MAYRLDADETLADGVRRIASEQIDHALACMEREGAGSPEAVHEARKCFKKVRGLVRLVRCSLGEAAYHTENQCFREAGRRLSPVRDSAVLIQTLQGLHDMEGGRQKEWFRTLAELLRDDHRATQAQLQQDGAAVRDVSAALRGARARCENWPLLGNEFALVEDGLQKVYRRGRSALAQCVREPAAENFHEWRKRAKYLWYHHRLLVRTAPFLLEPAAKRLHDLSDHLGDHHDLAVLRVRVERDDARRVVPPGETQELSQRISRRSGQLQYAALSLGTRLYAEKPGAFGSRMRAYWDAWRGSAVAGVCAAPQ